MPSAAMVVGAMGVVGIHDVPYDCKVRLRDVEVYEQPGGVDDCRHQRRRGQPDE